MATVASELGVALHTPENTTGKNSWGRVQSDLRETAVEGVRRVDVSTSLSQKGAKTASAKKTSTHTTTARTTMLSDFRTSSAHDAVSLRPPPQTSGGASPPHDAHFFQLRPAGEKIAVFFRADHASERGRQRLKWERHRGQQPNGIVWHLVDSGDNTGWRQGSLLRFTLVGN